MKQGLTKKPRDRDIDGVSLLWHLKTNGSQKLNRDALFWHFPHYRGNIVPYSIIREGNWKLIRRYEGKAFELYNLKGDLSESNDLSEILPAKVRQLNANSGVRPPAIKDIIGQLAF